MSLPVAHKLAPIEQLFIFVSSGASQSRKDDRVPLQALGAVDGQDLDGSGSFGFGRGKELLQVLLERVRIREFAAGFRLLQQIEVSRGVAKVLIDVRGGGRSAESDPGAFDNLAQTSAAAQSDCVAKHGEQPFTAPACIFRQARGSRLE